jgi:hypothetical protein
MKKWMLFGLVLLLVPAFVAAQEPEEEEPPPPVEVDLVFEREVFSYPTFQRRNPFVPLTGDETGPRFEQLQLLAVMIAPTPGQSIAMMAIGAGDGMRTYRVREGQVLGNVRIVRIQDRSVVVEVDEFGVRETRTLELPRPGQELPQEEVETMDVDPDTMDVDPDTTGTTDMNGTGGTV